MNFYRGFAKNGRTLAPMAIAISAGFAGTSCGSEPEKEAAKVPEVGSWRPMVPRPAASDDPVGLEYGAYAWTGSELLIWGGESLSLGCDPFCREGARYSVATGRWTPISSVGAPTARDRVSGVWTGDQLIAWGGGGITMYNTGPAWAQYGDGASYHLASDSWTPLAQSGAPAPREWHSAVWTGSRMIVWGGVDGHIQGRPVFMNDGAAYDPATDAWTPITSAGAPSTRYRHAAVWTGSLMIVWGGDSSYELPDSPLGDGAAYDPASDSWHELATANAPPPCNLPTAVWTGSTVLIWGCTGGGEYDPVSDTWRRISDYGAPGGVAHTAVWSGSAMLTWTGLNGPSGGVYDPVTDSWKRMPAEGSPGQRINHYAVWTGTEMLIFGGDDGDGGQYSGGALFKP